MTDPQNHRMNCPPARTFTHPDARLPLPGHIKASLPYCHGSTAAHTLDTTIKALGYDRAAEGHDIIIAYPHKHPDRQHKNEGLYFALAAQESLKKQWPETRLIMAHALYETVHLGRSEDRSSIHALSGQQRFAIDAGLQEDPLPFLHEAPTAARPALFIIVDDIIEQGTTIANMASFITHNGGTVVAALTYNQADALRQLSPLPQFFSVLDKPYDQGFAPTLATWFADAARRDKTNYTPMETVALMEAALQPHGRSLLTLTQGECNRLNVQVLANGLSPFLRQLGLSSERQDAIVQKRRAAPAPR